MADMSYMYRPRQTSYVYGTVHDLLDAHAAADPEKTAHVFWISRTGRDRSGLEQFSDSFWRSGGSGDGRGRSGWPAAVESAFYKIVLVLSRA